MRNTAAITRKIFSLDALKAQVAAWRATGASIAFTNGVFDLLHQGHIFSISQAAAEAQYLIVAVNSDASVKRLKRPRPPVHQQDTPALIMASLLMVDAVIIFEEDTPLQLITTLLPDVLVKGGDYTVDQIAGAKEVIAHGGRVVINPILPGISTSNIIASMQQPG